MIRIANKSDLAGIVSIYNESIPERMATADTNEITLESRLTWFNDHHEQRPLWVYETDHGIAGWLSFQNFYSRPAYQFTVEMSVYVQSKFKRQGIATKLLVNAIKECPSLNITTILSYIFGHNMPSINLVSRFGFKQWGFLPRIAVLDDIEKDVVIYGLRL